MEDTAESLIVEASVGDERVVLSESHVGAAEGSKIAPSPITPFGIVKRSTKKSQTKNTATIWRKGTPTSS